MCGLIFDLKLIFSLFEGNACSHKGQMHQHIDLIKGHPVAHLSFKPLKDRAAVAQIGVDKAAAPPGTVFLLQMQRHVKVADCHNRLDMKPQHFIDYIFVEFQSFLVGRVLFAGRENPGPGKGKAAAFKAHFRHQGDIFFPAVIHIDGFPCGEIGILRKLPVIHMALHHCQAVFAPWDHIHRSRPFPSFHISAFTLIGSRSAAP